MKNAIVSAIQKRANRRRLLPTVSIQRGFDPATYWDQPSSLIDEFLDFLRSRYGELHTRVLQHLLAGGETRKLFGRIGSRYAIKQAIRDVKAAARDFAGGDPEFLRMVEKAFASEKETVGKRQATVAAKRV